VGYIKGYGLKMVFGRAVLPAVGASDEDIVDAVNGIIQVKGGLAASDDGNTFGLPLPIAGLMSDTDTLQVASQ